MQRLFVSGVHRNKGQKCGKCSFCGLDVGHYVTSCPKKEDHQQSNSYVRFVEYDMNSSVGRDQLILKIETTMPMS